MSREPEKRLNSYVRRILSTEQWEVVELYNRATGDVHERFA